MRRATTVPNRTGPYADSKKAVIGLMCTGFRSGGYERWLLDLIRFVDHDKINFLGIAIKNLSDNAPYIVEEALLLTDLYDYKDVGWWANYDNKIIITTNWCYNLLDYLYERGKLLFVSHSVHDKIRGPVTTKIPNYWAAVSPITATVLPEPEKATIIPNCVDVYRCRPVIGREEIRRRWNLSDNQFAIAYLGRIANDSRKRPELVALAARLLGDHFVPIFISDIYDKQAAIRIRELNPKSKFITADGHVGDALSAVDCLVMASKLEASGLALLEAMAAGVPVVATRTGAVPYFTDKYGDVVMQVDVYCSIETLASAVMRAIVDKDIVERAKDVVLGNYTSEEFGRRWTEYLYAIHTGEASPDRPFIPTETYVSIMTTVCNTEPRYLREYWQSILSQTWKHWEVVLVDDGSTSSATIDELDSIAKDSRVRLIRLPIRCGISTARNIAIRAAKYDLIAIMDSDDIADPKWLARMVAAMKANPDVDICGCQIRAFEDKTNKTIFTTKHPPRIDGQVFMSMMEKDNFWFVNNPGVMFKRDKILKIGGYNDSLYYCEDTDVWLRAIKNGLNIKNIPDVLVSYRRHSDGLQITGGAGNRKRIQQGAFLKYKTWTYFSEFGRVS